MSRSLSTLLFLCSFSALFSQLKPLCFKPDSVYDARGDMRNLVSEDFDGDGFRDMAFGSAFTDSVVVFLNDRHGNMQYHSRYATEGYPQELVAGDFNNDSVMDLVTLNTHSNTVSLFLNSGDATFQAKLTFTVPHYCRSLATNDFNGDGYSDLVVASYGAGKLSVMLGTGSGSFQTPVLYNVIAGAEAVSTGDFNGDGKVDIASVYWTMNELYIHYGNGNGSFQAPVINYNYTWDNYPMGIGVADFNSDGYDDVVVIDNSTNLNYFAGNNTTTMGTYVSLGSTGHGNCESMGIGDINDDGKIDIVIPNGKIYLGYGNGSFSVVTTFSPAWGMAAVTVDLTNDSKKDLIIGNILSNAAPIRFDVIHNGPVLEVSGLAASLCAGHAPTVQVSGATTYSWSTGQQTATMTTTFSNNSTVTVTGFGNNGCVTTKTVQVEVMSTPDSLTLAGMQLDPNDGREYCKGDRVKLCVTGAQTYTWSSGSHQACLDYFPQANESVWVTMRNAGGCEKQIFAQVIVNDCVGLGENKFGAIKIYPNPASRFLIIASISYSFVVLYDQSGRHILHTRIEPGNNDISLEGIEAGLYLLKDESGNTAKVVVE